LGKKKKGRESKRKPEPLEVVGLSPKSSGINTKQEKVATVGWGKPLLGAADGKALVDQAVLVLDIFSLCLSVPLCASLCLSLFPVGRAVADAVLLRRWW
jgi:hypothetical protein